MIGLLAFCKRVLLSYLLSAALIVATVEAVF
jgi:hypothetical protein